ncbi:MAG: hypothetical protein [Bacteriophage sp.]|nr:MAG: hypothetical protein [Bacteriophage sp.]
MGSTDAYRTLTLLRGAGRDVHRYADLPRRGRVPGPQAGGGREGGPSGPSPLAGLHRVADRGPVRGDNAGRLAVLRVGRLSEGRTIRSAELER